MWKKIVVAALILTVIGATAVALWDNRSAIETPVASAQDVDNPPSATTPAATPAGSGPANAAKSGGSPAAGVGDPWSAQGQVVALDDTGMTVALADGSEVYVELGQPAFWQAQGVVLAAGDSVEIAGFDADGQIHAATVTMADGGQLLLRSATGQPLWSGGQGQAEAAGNGAAHSAGSGATQVPPADWQTISGTVAAVTRNGLTLQSDDGATITLQLGRADFWQSQAVTFATGDAIVVQGFAQEGKFQAAQITKPLTGERLLLRDPNGRPLWGGPGRNGNGGQGRGAAAAPAATTAPEQLP